MVIDILLIIFCIAGFWWGYTKGIAAALLHIVVYLVALLLSLKISPWLAEFLHRSLPIGKLFALIFGTIGVFFLLCFLLNYLVKRLDTYFQKTKLGTFNKVLGGVVMLLFSILIYGLLLGSINQLDVVNEKTKEASISYPILKPMPGYAFAVIEKLKPLFSQYWEIMKETMHETDAPENK